MKLNRKALLSSVAIVALAGGIAIGQVTLPQVSAITTSDLFPIIPQGAPTAQSQFASLARMRSANLAGVGSHTGKPTVTNCNLAAGTIAGNDFAFTLTSGNAATTSCVATFATAFNLAPVCTVQNAGVVTAGISFSVTTTAITITQPSLASQTYEVICVGLTGG